MEWNRSTEAREQIIALLQNLKKPDNYKFILSYNSTDHQVILELRKINGIEINTKKGKIVLFKHWAHVRQVGAEDYPDLLELIKKYPKYLETEIEV